MVTDLHGNSSTANWMYIHTYIHTYMYFHVYFIDMHIIIMYQDAVLFSPNKVFSIVGVGT